MIQGVVVHFLITRMYLTTTMAPFTSGAPPWCREI